MLKWKGLIVKFRSERVIQMTDDGMRIEIYECNQGVTRALAMKEMV